MRLVDYKELRKLFDEEYKRIRQLINNGQTHLDNLAKGFTGADKVIWKLPDVDAVEVVRCKDCANGCHKTDTTVVCKILNKVMITEDFFSYGAKMDKE